MWRVALGEGRSDRILSVATIILTSDIRQVSSLLPAGANFRGCPTMLLIPESFGFPFPFGGTFVLSHMVFSQKLKHIHSCVDSLLV